MINCVRKERRNVIKEKRDKEEERRRIGRRERGKQTINSINAINMKITVNKKKTVRVSFISSIKVYLYTKKIALYFDICVIMCYLTVFFSISIT